MQEQFYIIGVGASAGGLEALTELFSNIPASIRKHCAFIVAQHLSPNYKSMLVQILSKESNLPVIEAKNHVAIELGQIYITPPDYDVKVGGGLLVLSKPSNPSGPKPSVDVLFTSLATEYKSQALGIILSGTGSDGAAGLEAIKSQGGFAIIQNPENSKYDGMPVASLQTGVVDFSLPAKKIGEKIVELLFHNDELIVTPQDDELLRRLHAVVHEKYGTNFENYKDSTILRRIDKCAKNAGVKNMEEYVHLVSTNALELQNLYESFLINVTSFFRDPDSFMRLEKEIEERIKKYSAEKDFRVWIPGCSTGQEAYSLAMIIQRQLELSGRQNCVLQIFATDLDEDALAIARRGVYTAADVAAIPVAYQHQYLIETPNGYEFSKAIRSRILFSKHDVTINPPFLKLDMVSCRNLLIYLNSHLQRKIFPVFHYAMKENGLLFLGKSESVHVVDDLFDVVDGHFKIFRKRKFGSINQSVRFSSFRPLTVKTEWERKSAQYNVTDYHARLHETFVGLSGHAYFVVNGMMDIIETKGDVSDFVQIPEGALNLNISKLLRSEVQAEVRNVLIKAMKERKNISGPLRKVNVNKQYYFIRVECGLIGKDLTPESGELYLLIIEKFNIEDELSKLIPGQAETDGDPRIQELEEELTLTKEHLQTYIEEIETSNEELQSLNEELQSANEELQSSNEELETTNEELQASNEELQTAYAEIKHINEELSVKENTLRETIILKNAIFDNTQHANILINKDDQIDLFNREARRVLKVMGVNHPETGANLIEMLPEGVNHVMQELIDASREDGRVVTDLLEVDGKNGKAYFEICLTPVIGSTEPVYRSIAIGLLDVTNAKAYESELNKKDKMLMSLLESTSNYLIRTDMEGKYTYVNDAFCEKFGFPREQVLGKYYAPTVHPEDIKECEKAMEKLSMNPDGVVIFEMRKPNPAGGFFNTEWEFVFVRDERGEIVEVQGVGHDITSQKTAYAELEKDRNKLELILWSGRLGSWEWDMDRREVHCNAFLMSLLGKGDHAQTIEPTAWESWIHQEDALVYNQRMDETIRGNIGYFDMKLRLRGGSGFVSFDFTGKVVERNSKGGAVRLMGVLREAKES